MQHNGRERHCVLFISFLVGSWINPTYAHVKWFSDSSNQPLMVQPFSLFEPQVVTAIAICITAFLFAGFLHRFSRDRILFFPSFLSKPSCALPMLRIAQILLGSALVLGSAQQTLFAPHFNPPSNLMPYLILSEGVIGIALIAGHGVHWVAAALMALYSLAMPLFGLAAFLEYLPVIGLAAVFSFQYPQSPKAAITLAASHGLTLLRLSLGISLITLGLTEKLLNPQGVVSLLQKFSSINFMQALGLNYSDRLFALSAGSAEVLFGLVYLANWIPRINTLALACFLVASNTYFFYIGDLDLATMELLGHLPLFACALLILMFGGGHSLRELATGLTRRSIRIRFIRKYVRT